jgi:hypothetical protein
MGQNSCCSDCHKKDQDFDLFKVMFTSDDKYRRRGGTLKKKTSNMDTKLALDQMQNILSRPNSLKSSNSTSLRHNLKRLFSEETEASEDLGTLIKDSKAITKQYLAKFISDAWILNTDSDGVQVYTYKTDSPTEFMIKRSMIVGGTTSFIAAVLQDLEDIEESSGFIEKLEEKLDFCNGSRTIHRVDNPIGNLKKHDYYYCNTLKKLDTREVYITNHSIKSDTNMLKDSIRGMIEGVTRIKPITESRALVTEIIKIDMKQKIQEADYEKLLQIHFNEYLELKNSLTSK